MKAGPSSSTKVPSTEVYRIARQVVGPWLKANGFRREPAFASWTRPVAGRHVTMWFQVSHSGWDPLAGSTFVVELQRSDRPEVGYGRLRARVVELLDPVGREEVRAIRNAVAARLRRPSLAEVRARFGFEPPADMLELYVAAFAPRLAPYAAAAATTGSNVDARPTRAAGMKRIAPSVSAKGMTVAMTTTAARSA